MSTQQQYPGTAIGVVVFKAEEGPDSWKVLLGKRKGELGPGEYSLPGGKIDFSETPFQAANREVKEETNLNLTQVVCTGNITNDFFPEQQKHFITVYYTATAVNPDELVVKEPHKIENWEWFDIREPLPQPIWMHTGKLLESLTNAYFNSFYTEDVDGPAE